MVTTCVTSVIMISLSDCVFEGQYLLLGSPRLINFKLFLTFCYVEFDFICMSFYRGDNALICLQQTLHDH